MKDSKDSYKQKKWEAVVSEHKRMCDIVEKYSGCTPSYNPLLVYATERKELLEQDHPILCKDH